MFISKLQIINFKNFTQQKLIFTKDFVGITGKNGKGKTSILDAIHYLALTKSYINALDKYNINFDADFFNLKGEFIQEEEEWLIQVLVQKGKKKEVKKNNKMYTRLSDHIGLIKTVVISPYDRDLIWEGSEVRRRFLDHLISQIDATYLDQLIKYNKVLNQRNTILKFFRDNHTFDANVIESYNEQMKTSGSYIYQKRKEISEELAPVFQELYKEISRTNEQVSLQYVSHLDHESWNQLFQDSETQDRQSGYTQKGIHKDDIELNMSFNPVKRIASQGQQKTFVIAMRLAETQILINRTRQKPILLLDDIFDKLDENRVQQLIQLLEEKTYGQVLLTDTDHDRIASIFSEIPNHSEIIAL